ncbi:MAG: hypothetical protein ACP5L4_07225, partial [Thermoplasmata archaeon]
IEEKKVEYFKTELFFSYEYFIDFGVEFVDYYYKDGWHFYAIAIPETLKGEEAYRFSSIFSVNAQPIQEAEFKRNRKEVQR